MIINTLNEKLHPEITLRGIERTHRIREPKKTKVKTRPITVKFVQHKNRNRIFRNKKKLKCERYQLTKTLRKQGWIN